MKIEFKSFKNLLKKKITLSAVILAAGASERFGENKIAYKLEGRPVYIRTIEAFEASKKVDEIILVVKKEEVSSVASIVSEYGFTKLKKVVAGGSTRQESALRGFEAITPEAEYVAIHDAARCLITPEMIESVYRAARIDKAAAAAHKMTDTVKYATADGYVDRTLDRDYVYTVSTPQIFLADLYRASAYTAREAGFSATDDCMLAERLGFPVKLVEVGADNIKITYKDDIARAREILMRRKEEESAAAGGKGRL